MWNKLQKGSLLSFLLVCSLSSWFLIIMGTEWRDWSDSDSWQAVTTTEFTIQPKSSSVRYRYVVDRNQLEGDRIHFFVTAPFQDQRVLQWINEHRQATELTVYYNPDAPNRAVLVRAVDSQWALQFPIICGIGGLAILLPLLFFSTIWSWLRKQFPIGR